MAKLNRYEIPVPDGHDGESVNLCDDCHRDCPPELIGEWLEDKPSWHECDGIPGGDGCPHGDEDEEDPDE